MPVEREFSLLLVHISNLYHGEIKSFLADCVFFSTNVTVHKIFLKFVMKPLGSIYISIYFSFDFRVYTISVVIAVVPHFLERTKNIFRIYWNSKYFF